MLARRRLSLALGLALCAVPGTALSSSAGSVIERPPYTTRTSELVDRLAAPARLPIDAGRMDARRAFQVLLGGQTYPGTCATPFLLALRQHAARLSPAALQLLDALGLPPAADRMPSYTTSTLPGAFRIRYSVDPGNPGSVSPEDSDLDGVPDQVAQIAAGLSKARDALLDLFESSGMPQVWAASSEPVHDVLITDLPDPLTGYVTISAGREVLVLDRQAAVSPDGVAVMRHEVAHLFQLALTADESPWWYEAHAIWAEDPSGTRAARRSVNVSAYLAGSSEGLATERLGAFEGTFLWPHYLVATAGPNVLGAAWEEMADVAGENTLAAFDATLQRVKGSSLSSEVRAFRIWNVFLGEMDDGNHYPFGSDLNSSIDSYISTYPAFWHGSAPLAPLGGQTLQLSANTLPGGWLLDFEGDVGAGWSFSVLTIPARLGDGPRMAEIGVDNGKASAAIPWRDLAAVIVVVQNLGGERTEASRFSLSARHDPLVPFDLMSFAPEIEDGGVALEWHTDKEVDLLGWRLYRSQDPLSGFAPIQTLLIPAGGGPDVESYMFLDTTVKPGRKYYYFLEGVTKLGFTEPTHPVSVRIPDELETGTLE